MLKIIKKYFRSYQGRNFLSRWGRKIFERSPIRQILGLNLAALVFLVSVLAPQAEAFLDKQKISNLSSKNFPAMETKTQTTLSWPVKNPQISQDYHFGHWALDIVSGKKEAGKWVKEKEAKIYPVDKGVVIKVTRSRWAYGNHLIIKHPHNRRSLYAHLKKIYVKEGEEVDRETPLGEMGRSGWASGIHLHLEIYQENQHLNPLSILP